jgi:hypothetical protein
MMEDTVVKTLTLLLLFGLLFLALRYIDRRLSAHLARRGRMQREELAEILSDLAKATGLSLDPLVDRLPAYGSSAQPALSGSYRGRPATLGLSVSAGDRDSGLPPNVYLVTTLRVENPGHFTLTVREKDGLANSQALSPANSGDRAFDRRYSVKGSPTDFVETAIALIVNCKPIAQSSPSNVVLMTHPDATGFSRATWHLPSIELEGSDLTCVHHGLLIRVQDQIVILEMLCKLADMVEYAAAAPSLPDPHGA